MKFYNPRDFVVPKHLQGENEKAGTIPAELTYADRRVDNRPYGGGPGMVIEALPIVKAIDAAVGEKLKNAATKKKVKIIFFSPGGKTFSNTVADGLKRYTDVVMVSGRYEGIDARVKKVFPMTDISIGDYTLTGGELPAMVLIDAITRRIPGVLGDDLSIEESRVSSHDVYTRPEVFSYNGKNHKVPKVLLSGHHKDIDEWKLKGKAKK